MQSVWTLFMYLLILIHFLSLDAAILRAGTSEMRNWIAVAGALSQTNLSATLIDYVPYNVEQEVLEKALQIGEREAAILADALSGVTLREARARHGYHQLQRKRQKDE